MEPDPGHIIRRHEETICQQTETIRQQERIIQRQQRRIAELEKIRRPPQEADALKLSRRFDRRGAPTYFRFLDEPGVEPTNNATERAIRQPVLDRRVGPVTDRRDFPRLPAPITSPQHRTRSLILRFGLRPTGPQADAAARRTTEMARGRLGRP